MREDGRKKHGALLEVILVWINIDPNIRLEEEVNHHRVFCGQCLQHLSYRAIKIHLAHTARHEEVLSNDAYTV